MKGLLYSNLGMVAWKAGTDCCSWDGVTCHGVTGHVIALDISCRGLRDNLNPTLPTFRPSETKSYFQLS